MDKKWIMRPYRSGDENKITKLYRMVFGKDMDVQHWKWRFKDNPVGLLTIILAESENDLVGQYALCPVKMKIGNSIRTTALSLDTMVHPDYRDQGMFVKLATQLYKNVARQGFAIIYGFPNKSSHHGIVSRLGWIDLCERVPLFVKPLNVKRILARKVNSRFFLTMGSWLGKAGVSLLYPTRRSELSGDSKIRQVASFDYRVDQLWKLASSAFNIMLVRDHRYLNWRFVEKPHDTYTIFFLEREDDILGYIVLKSVEKFGLQIGFVVDLLTVPDRSDISKCLVSKAVDYFKELQNDMVGCLMLKHGPYVQALRANGFVFLSNKFHPQEMYLGVRRNTEAYASEFITHPNNWYITWADHDDI